MVSFPLIKLWDKRSLVIHFSLLNLKIRFRNTYLGFLWAAIEPLVYFIVLFVVFSEIRDATEDFAVYLITGIMLFHIFARGTAGGASSLILNIGIIQSLNIRKEFFPVVTTVAIALLAFVDVGVFLGIMPVFQFIPSWTIILLPIVLFLLIVLILGLTYFLSIIMIYFRDVQIIWTMFVYTLLFVSPIFWYVNEVEDKGEGILLQIQQINPLGQLIELAHVLVIEGQIPSLGEWMYTTFFILSIFFFGYFVFHKMEDKISEKL